MELDALVLSIATVAVAVALVYATWNLFRATRSMDWRQALEARRALILRKLELARIVGAMGHGEFIDRLKGGSVPVNFPEVLELAGILVGETKDTAVVWSDLRRIVGTLTQANSGSVYQERQAEEEWTVLTQVKGQLNGSISGWYDELGMIAAELGRVSVAARGDVGPRGPRH